MYTSFLKNERSNGLLNQFRVLVSSSFLRHERSMGLLSKLWMYVTHFAGSCRDEVDKLVACMEWWVLGPFTRLMSASSSVQ